MNVFDTYLKITPIIVCGAARSGTRMACDILNKHAECCVQDEMHAKTFEAYVEFVDKVQGNFNHYSALKGRALDANWRASQAVLHHVFFSCANKKGAMVPGRSAMYHGVKTPGYERYFSTFEAMFPSRVPPVYVYCLRDAYKVWRSWLTREFLSVADIDLFLVRYRRSLRQAVRIKRQSPGRFVLFDLDDYIAAGCKKDWIVEHLLSPLAVPENPILDYENIANTNSSKALGLSLVPEGRLMGEGKIKSDVKIMEYRSVITGAGADSAVSAEV